MESNHEVLVVDDEDKIINVLEAYLKKCEYKVLTAQSGKQALEIFKDKNPSLIILDLMLPDISGEDVCQEIRKVSNVPIIMLTAKTHESSVLDGFSFGADDYVAKPFSSKEVIARVNALIKRTYNHDGENIPKKYFDDGFLSVQYSNNLVEKNNTMVALTPKEYKILSTLIKYKNKIFTREELINVIYDHAYDGYDRTIDVHIKNLRQKIEKNTSKPKYIITVYGSGYKFERFYRGDKSRNQKTGGFGIGLSISKAIIEAHNGEIFVNSKLDEGAEFLIIIPNN